MHTTTTHASHNASALPCSRSGRRADRGQHTSRQNCRSRAPAFCAVCVACGVRSVRAIRARPVSRIQRLVARLLVMRRGQATQR
jgi:hypothetical protein